MNRSILHLFTFLALLALLAFLMPVQSYALSVSAGFNVPNFQIFPIGDFVDMDVIEDPDADIDFTTMAEFFYLALTRNPGIPADSLNAPIVIHLNLRLSGEELLDYESPPTTINEWTQGGDSRTYYNNEFENAPWFRNDPDPYYADAETFLGLIEAGNLRTAVFFLTFEVYRLDADGNREAMPADQVTLITQVYNPSEPELLEPESGAVLNGTPIQFRWNWTGGPMIPADWTLIIVEGPEGADGETVIQSRNPTNTRFEGQPHTTESHLYMGMAGQEQALQAGATYYWQTIARVYSILGSPTEYTSNIFSFTISDAGAGGGPGGGGLGGGGLGGGALGGGPEGGGEGGEGDDWGGGPFGGAPEGGEGAGEPGEVGEVVPLENRDSRVDRVLRLPDMPLR